MSNVTIMPKGEVQEIINELIESQPDSIIVFMLKDGNYALRVSEGPNLHATIGVLERMKHTLMAGEV
jgi:hypothetical protein